MRCCQCGECCLVLLQGRSDGRRGAQRGVLFWQSGGRDDRTQGRKSGRMGSGKQFVQRRMNARAHDLGEAERSEAQEARLQRIVTPMPRPVPGREQSACGPAFRPGRAGLRRTGCAAGSGAPAQAARPGSGRAATRPLPCDQPWRRRRRRRWRPAPAWGGRSPARRPAEQPNFPQARQTCSATASRPRQSDCDCHALAQTTAAAMPPARASST